MVLVNFGHCKNPIRGYGSSVEQAKMNSDITNDNTAMHLTLENLSCTRGDNLLFEDLNLTLQAGECLHLTGPNGAGKTSLLRIVCGLMPSDSGNVRWKGEDASSNEAFAQQCFYLAHKDALKNELTAIENLRIIQALEGTVDEDALDDALAKMQILSCADLPVQALSFGQRRRLAFAKLLIIDRELWILDEPFTGIDKNGKVLIENLCIEHLKGQGSILLTHHQKLESTPLNDYLKECDIREASK